MDQTTNNTKDTMSRLNLGGDYTYQSLNDMTKANSALMDILMPSNSSPRNPSQTHTTQATHRTTTTTSSSQPQDKPDFPALQPTKRNPEDIVRQLQVAPKRPLIENQKTIENYKQENLELKIQLGNLRKSLEAASSKTGIRLDIVEKLSLENERLQKELEERDRREQKSTRDRGCQTNLDMINIEELVGAYVELKRLKAELANKKHQAPQCGPERRPQQQTSVMKQIHYPYVTPQQQQQQQQLPTSSKIPMSVDEKKILDMLYTLDGRMTTVFDKLRANSNYIPE